MGKIKGWRKIDNLPDYIVWHIPQRKNYNPFAVVVKTENDEWVSFLDTGTFGGGVKILNRGGSKEKNMKIAIKFMKQHPRG